MEANIATPQSDEVDDLSLVKQYRASGDPEILGLLFYRHSDAAYRIAVRQARGNRADAEEAVQCTFAKFLENDASNLAVSSNVRSYIVGAVINNCRQLQREEIGRRHRQEKFGLGLPEADQDGKDAYERREQEQKLKEALDSLPEELRLPIWMHYYEEMSFHEMSEALKTKEITLRHRVDRGLKLLRVRLKNGGYAHAALIPIPDLLGNLPVERCSASAGFASPDLASIAKGGRPPSSHARMAILLVTMAAVLGVCAYIWMPRFRLPAPVDVQKPAPSQGLIYADDFSSRELCDFWRFLVNGKEGSAVGVDGPGRLRLSIANSATDRALEVELISQSLPMGATPLYWDFRTSRPSGSGSFTCGIELVHGGVVYCSNRLEARRAIDQETYTMRSLAFTGGTEAVGDGASSQNRPLLPQVDLIGSYPARTPLAEVDQEHAAVPEGRFRIYLRLEPGSKVEWIIRRVAIARDQASLDAAFASPVQLEH